jgi:uncharacterized membrane protein YdjX (TVP38/TMEM64 family)
VQGTGTIKLVKLAVVVLLIGVCALLVATDEVNLLAVQKLLQHNSFAPLIFLALHVAFSLLFLPRAVMAIAAGLVFGFWTGMLWATAGSLIGALSGFWLARYFAGDLVTPSDWSRFGPVVQRIETGGWRAVTMMRLIPAIPHSLSNYLLALTDIGVVDFAIGSLIGQLPMTVAFVQFGAAGVQVMAGRPEWLRPTLTGVAILLLSMLPQLWQRVARRQKRSSRIEVGNPVSPTNADVA